MPYCLSGGQQATDFESAGAALDAALRAGSAASPSPLRARVQTFPPGLAAPLVQAMIAGLEEDAEAVPAYSFERQEYDVVVSVVRLARDDYRFGVGPPDTYSGQTSSPRAAAATVAMPCAPVSRAFYKLAEGVERWEKLHGAMAFPPGSVALDLGAAPGSWSQYLASRGCHVLAVDPGSLAPELTAVETIEHWPVVAKEALATLAAEKRECVAVVCDMCLHDIGDARRAVLEAGQTGVLAKGALVVVAIKVVLGRAVATIDKTAQVEVDAISPHLDDMEVFHLFSSRDKERTVVGRWKYGPGECPEVL